MRFPGAVSTWVDGFPRSDFVCAERPVTVACPRSPLPGRHWAWKGEFLEAFLTTELALLAAARIPILHVCGDADDVVPWDENTGVLAERYRQLGGEITLIAKPGIGHHPHGLEDPTAIVEFIWRHTVAQESELERVP